MVKPKSNQPFQVAIVGSGPAGLMCASQLQLKMSKPNTLPGPLTEIHIFEKNTFSGRKILIAGSSGLNITNSQSETDFYKSYSGGTSGFWKNIFKKYSPTDWINFIHNLGHETFLGTSGRHFIKEMKASKFLNSWVKDLKDNNVNIHTDFDLQGIHVNELAKKIILTFLNKESREFDAVLLALGGASYTGNNCSWPKIFKKYSIPFSNFKAENSGYHVKWPKKFLEESEGSPLKNIKFTSAMGSMLGELTITKYGIEGTPVYTLGRVEVIFLDLKPDLTSVEIQKKCSKIRENLSPLRKLSKALHLSSPVQSLLYHLTPKEHLMEISKLVEYFKHFPLKLVKPQPIEDAISTSGGIDFEALDESLMLKKLPGVFLGGEMLNWNAPTGGFLIQGCVSQGCLAAHGILRFLEKLELG